jgi:hypothetical protein
MRIKRTNRANSDTKYDDNIGTRYENQQGRFRCTTIHYNVEEDEQRLNVSVHSYVTPM